MTSSWPLGSGRLRRAAESAIGQAINSPGYRQGHDLPQELLST
jgi:hypothetical protein